MNDERRAPRLGGLGHALRPLWICGMAGILVDVDHLVLPIQLLLAGQTPTWNDIAGRPLHTHSILVCWTICGAIAACCMGQFIISKLNHSS